MFPVSFCNPQNPSKIHFYFLTNFNLSRFTDHHDVWHTAALLKHVNK